MEAAVEAMQGDQGWLSARNEIYRQRRDIDVYGLRRLGVEVEPPRASLYVWAPVPKGWQSVAFVTSALEQARVSLTPGDMFGVHGEGYFRIALTAPNRRVSEAMERLERWLTR
jgi:LL-diaminopimelate aminotransferase